MWFRYHTMRYRFTDEGISMSWGILFRREIIVNYARIQDIHLRSNIVERWLGLARILVQTASGSSSAELTLEGLKQFEAVRDFLYSKMRGVKDAVHHPAPAVPTASASHDSTVTSELATTLREVTGELRAILRSLETTSSADAKGSHVYQTANLVAACPARTAGTRTTFWRPGLHQDFSRQSKILFLPSAGLGLRAVIRAFWFDHRRSHHADD